MLRGKGRAAGTPNRIGAELREMILLALEDAGGRAYLARQAEENPAAFMALLAKIIPKEVKAEVSATHHVSRLTPEQLSGIVDAVRGGHEAG